MLPPLKTVKAGLRRTTEALAIELASGRPGNAMPAWTALDWQLATAAVAAHGIGPLLSKHCRWQNPAWQSFLREQHDHVAMRYQRIADTLQRLDVAARAAGIAIVPLKGSALHALGLYAPGDRPMADIDLLVREDDLEAASELLQSLGYTQSYAQWKHRVFKPDGSGHVHSLGEHRDTPVNIELHTRIQERLPITPVDITARIYPRNAKPGLNAYPSLGALMSHLLLHAAGNVCGRSVRLLHVHDISLLATRMVASDWQALWGEDGVDDAWWALPPLRLVDRYYPLTVPATVWRRLQSGCPRWLRATSRRQHLTDVSCSALWLRTLPGIEWSRSLGEAVTLIHRRFRPTQEAIDERAQMVRTQTWLQGQAWVRTSHVRRILKRLTQRVPRMDTLYVVRKALDLPSV